MKRWEKIILGVFLVLCVGAAGLIWQFQNEIKALQYHLEYSREEQEVLVQENENRMDELLEQVNIPEEVISDIKAESVDETKPSTPEVTAQEPPKQETVKNEPVKKEPVKPEKPQQNYDPELAGMIGEIYALRTSFVGQLDQLLVEARNEYIAVPAEKREKQKSVILNKYIKKAGGLEANCDSQMNEILGRMKTHLKKTGGDTSLVGEIQNVYENEKALKKAYYLSLAE